MADGQQEVPASNSSSARKRKFAASDLDSMMHRMYGNHNVNPLTSQIGPIHPVDSESFILNQK